MKKIIEFFRSLFGMKPKPPVIVVPPIETKPEEKPVDIPVPEEKPKEPDVVWKDRRAIGMVMLANYQTWTGTDNYMNEDFVAAANNCISMMKDINAQGCIVWDPEGAKFPRAYTYYGDPKLTPEKVDSFFDTIKNAGFKVGVCLRPDVIKWEFAEQMQTISPEHYTTASPLQNLIDKVEYARNRWGCVLFYVDSNVGIGLAPGTKNTTGAGNMMPASIFSELHRLYPDCLFIPEWHDETYDAHTALYWHTSWTNNLRGLAVINTGDTWWSQEMLNKAVKDGHILMSRVFWSGAPELPKVKAAYQNQKI